MCIYFIYQDTLQIKKEATLWCSERYTDYLCDIRFEVEKNHKKHTVYRFQDHQAFSVCHNAFDWHAGGQAARRPSGCYQVSVAVPALVKSRGPQLDDSMIS